MILSQTAEYALRAMVYLATQASKRHVTQDIAAATCIPCGYLAKVLQRLHKSGLVVAQRGLRGGYGLAKPANEISLYDIISAIDPAIPPSIDRKEVTEKHQSMEALYIQLNQISDCLDRELKTRTLDNLERIDSSLVGRNSRT
jgi:Rrf2 family protein